MPLITSFSLKFGSSPSQPAISVETPSVTVFVGPNNSGKSQLLREIQTVCQSGNYGGLLILDRIVFETANPAEAQAELATISSPARMGETIDPSQRFVEINEQRFQVNTQVYAACRQRPNERDQYSSFFATYHSSRYTLPLDGAGRVHLLNPQSRGDLKTPSTPLGRLLKDDARRELLRQTIYDSVGLYFGIDISVSDKLNIRFGQTPPPNERSVEDATLDWMTNALPLERVSDGVKAFAGILIELKAGDPRVIIIDEPEAFLHPSLAFKLGKEIAKTASDDTKQVFVATHSVQFLMGVIQSGVRVNIVRLTYQGEVATARLLPNQNLVALLRDPMLRSANTLSGLFYQNVVVTEADADRAFYQETNERLLECGDPRGIPNTLFVNANGKDTVNKIVSPLRHLGIPTVAIMDIDAINTGGQNWTKQLAACSIPTPQHQAIGAQRGIVWNALAATGKDPKTNGGLSLLQGEYREAADNLFNALDEYGLLSCAKVRSRIGCRNFPFPGANIFGCEKYLRRWETIRQSHRTSVLATATFGTLWAGCISG